MDNNTGEPPIPENNPLPDIQQNPIAQDVQPSNNNQNVPSTTPTLSPFLNNLLNVLIQHKIITIIIAVVIIFLVTLTTVFSMAYNVLPIGTAKMRSTLGEFVMSIPFMPKSPEYLLRRTFIESIKIKKFGFDFKFSADGFEKDFMDLNLENNELIVAANGKADISNMQRLLGKVNLKIAKDINVDLISIEDKTFFRINKLPKSITSSLVNLYGFPETLINKFLKQWLYFEYKTSINEEEDLRRAKENEEYFNQVIITLDNAIKKGTIRLKSTVTSDKVDNQSTFKVVTKLDKKTLDAIEMLIYNEVTSKQPNYYPDIKYTPTFTKNVSNIDITNWIDKRTYQTVQMQFDSEVLTETMNSTSNNSFSLTFPSESILEKDKIKQKVNLKTVIKYSDLDKEIKTEVPENAISFEKFSEMVFLEMQNSSSSGALNPIRAYSQASNVKRKSDISSISRTIKEYSIRNDGLFPSQITTTAKEISSYGADICKVLIPEFVITLPIDPKRGNNDGIKDCSTSYMTGYYVKLEADGNITVSAPLAELDEIISETL